MDEADRGASLRETIEELKLELVRFVLFEVREGEKERPDQLAAPIHQAIEKAVQAVVDSSFQAGTEQIKDAAKKLDIASAGVASGAQKIESRLDDLMKKLAEAEGSVKRHLELSAKLAVSEGGTSTTTGPEPTKPKSNAFLKSLAEQQAGSDQHKPGDESPASPSPSPGAPLRESGPALRERLAGWCRWLGRPKQLAVVLSTLLGLAALTYVVFYFSRDPAPGPSSKVAETPKELPNTFYAQGDLRDAATNIRSILDAEGPLNPAGSERRQRLIDQLQLGISAIAELNRVFGENKSPTPEQQQYLQRLGRLQREATLRQGNLTNVPEGEKSPPPVDIAELRGFADRLEQAANATPSVK